jgi:hypothetical protein
VRRLAQLAVWLTAVLGAALALSFATSNATSSGPAASDDGLPVRLPPAPGLADPSDPGAAAAARAPGRQSAAPQDVAASLALVRNDVTFRKILGSTGFEVVDSEPWTNEGGDRLVGTSLELKLDSALSGPVRLPGIRFNPGGSSYRQLKLNARVDGATALTVLVDQQSGRVVSVMPPDSTLTELSGNQHIPPASGPNGD